MHGPRLVPIDSNPPTKRSPETSVTSTALVTFVVIGGFVWGGFVFFAALAMRKEQGKIRAREREERGSP